MRKIYVTATVQLTINADEGVEIGDIMCGLEIQTTDGGADVLDHQVMEFEVTDSK